MTGCHATNTGRGKSDCTENFRFTNLCNPHDRAKWKRWKRCKAMDSQPDEMSTAAMKNSSAVPHKRGCGKENHYYFRTIRHWIFKG